MFQSESALIDELLATRPTAKRLILSLLSAPSMETVRVGLLVRWAALFEIDAAAVRVAIGRLVRQGLVTTLERGVYGIGPAGSRTAQTARQWMDVEARVRPRSGGWIAIHTAHLGRTNKTALRARERALRLHGFAELQPGLWCRPDNLVAAPEATRASLVELGLEDDAVTMRVTELPGVDPEALARLWPRAELEAGYHAFLAAMATSTERMPGLSSADAARETFLVGEAVIRQINADPLLPSDMVDDDARRALVQGMVRYNELGERVWAAFSREVAAG